MNIQGGGLSFEISGTNKQLLSVLNESKKAIQQFSTTAAQGGANIDKAFQATAAQIDKAFAQIDAVENENKAALTQLQQKYAQLGKQAGAAFTAGRDQEYAALTRQQEQLKAEIRLRKTVIAEAAKTADALLQEEQALKKQQEAATKNATAQTSLRTQLRNVREELAMMEQNGQRGTEAFAELQQEAGRLTDALGDATAQARILSHDNRGLQGMISGLSGVAGAFTAAQGAIGLFAGENEDLQRVMLRVQSLMSITMGLQQVANTLNKDSAFRLNTLNTIKKWWGDLTGKNIKTQQAATAATEQSTTAHNANAGALRSNQAAVTGTATATELGTKANKGFAISFRAVGAAIKSIPIIGLIAVGISALLGVFDKSSKKVDEAAQKQAEKLKELREELARYKKELRDLSGLSSNVAAEEIVKLDRLYRAATNENKSRKDRIAAIKELKKEWPQWFGNISDERIEVDKLATAYRDLKDNILLYARAEAIKERVKSNTAKIIDFELEYGSVEKAENAQTGMQRSVEQNNKWIAQLQALGARYNAEAQKVAQARAKLQNAQRQQRQNYDPGRDQYAEEQAVRNAQQELNRVQSQFSKWYADFKKEVDAAGWKVGGKAFSRYLEENASEGYDFNQFVGNSVRQFRTANEELNTEKQKYEETLMAVRQLTEENDKLDEMLKNTPSPISTENVTPTPPRQDEDTFLTMLNKRKALYADYVKWVTSEDATVRAAAETEFSELLSKGSSYIDFLERLRDGLEAKTNKTAIDIKNLATINNEIAQTVSATVLETFNAQLQQELAQCKTIGEMLATIERRRSELSGDNSDVDNAKAEILNTAEADTKQQAKEETKALLQEYAGYLQEKIDFEESYARNKELLTRRAAEAATDAERRVAETALAALEAKREEYAKRSGSEQYDALLQEYQTYQQQETAILEKYAAQRQLAEQQGNAAMIAQINAKQQSELSKLAAQRLMASESWAQLFSDISRLSTNTINRLLNDINSRKINLSAEFNPADLKAINDQLQKAKNELQTRNPFLALRQSLSELRAAMRAEKLLDSDDPFVESLNHKKYEYQQYTEAINSSDTTLAGAAKEAYADLLAEGSSYVDMLRRKIATLNGLKIKGKLTIEGQEQLDILNAALNKEQGITKSVGAGFKEAFGDLGSSLTFLSSCFGSVVNGIKKMGISMDEETEAILGDIGGMMDGAAQLSQGIATGNPLGIIQGSIGFLSSAFDLFNSRDRKAEKSIKKHEEAVTRLGRAYTALEHAVDNALGETVYKNQNALIQNLRQQQNEIQGMINDEISKKHTDWGRVEEFQERYAEAGRQIEDIIAEITKSITQTDAKEASTQLMDAIIESCEEGGDALKNLHKVYEDVANDIVKKAVANALRLQFLEKPLQAAIKQLQKDMGFDAEGNGSFDGLTQAEQDRFKAAVAAAGANFKAAMDMYKDLFAELDESDPTSLSGAIKGASQESIDLLAGQTNAVRQNQVVAIEIFRQQLIYLSNMDNKLGNIAASLISILNRMGIDDSDDLRSQGITD